MATVPSSDGVAQPRPRGAAVFLRAACLLSCTAFIVHAAIWAPRLTNGFAMYYTYARLALEGNTLAGAYGEEYFNAKVREFGFDLRDEPNNIPTAALPYLPVAWLPPSAAKIAWTALSLLLFAWSLKILFALSRLRAGDTLGLLLLTLLFLWHPAWEALALGQVYVLLLVVFILFIRHLSGKKGALSGVFLALAALFKGYGGVPAVLLGMRRKWNVIGVSAALAAGMVLVTMPVLGVESWRAFYDNVLRSLGSRPEDAHVTYQTLNGFVRHLLTYDAVWLRHPLADAAPWVVTMISYGVNSALILGTVIAFRNAGEREDLLAYGAAIAAGVMTAPLAEEYHYVLFLPLLFGLVAQCAGWRERGGTPGLPEALGVLAALAMAAPSATHALQDSAFPLVLLAYGKLAAGLAMLAAGVLALMRDRREVHPGIHPDRQKKSPLPKAQGAH